MEEWFKSLSQHDRKQLVSLLYEARPGLTKSAHYHLFEKLLQKTDDAYHALKKKSSRLSLPIWD